MRTHFSNNAQLLHTINLVSSTREQHRYEASTYWGIMARYYTVIHASVRDRNDDDTFGK